MGACRGYQRDFLSRLSIQVGLMLQERFGAVICTYMCIYVSTHVCICISTPTLDVTRKILGLICIYIYTHIHTHMAVSVNWPSLSCPCNKTPPILGSVFGPP